MRLQRAGIDSSNEQMDTGFGSVNIGQQVVRYGLVPRETDRRPNKKFRQEGDMQTVTRLTGMDVTLGPCAEALARGGAVVRQPVPGAATQVSSENDGSRTAGDYRLQPSALCSARPVTGVGFQLSYQSRSQRPTADALFRSGSMIAATLGTNR
jgi:hypothetical protein